MPLEFWGIPDYLRSWCRAFVALGESSSSTSCLMTSMSNPETANYLSCWPLYRDSETVYVQNSILFLDEVRGAFDPSQPWSSISPRETVDDDGNVLSEWRTSMNSMREFFDARCSQRGSEGSQYSELLWRSSRLG
ncbi:hypothetical protein [Micromonospora sp. SH-82]|uniref:hypothetical protein n=1 Tax=Micromonospora sp. SH-82 TaxID=3132938 RepID=UPI003EC135AB